MTQRIEPFFNMTQRIEPSFEDVSMDWTFFLRLNDLILFFFKKKKKWPSRIQPFWKIWLKELNFFVLFKELNLFFENYSQNYIFFSIWLTEMWLNWTFFFNMTQRIEPLFFLNMTPEIEPFFSACLKEIELFTMWLKELNFFWILTQRIEFFLEDDAKNWTFYDPKNWTLFQMIQRTNFLSYFSKHWFFWVWRKELNHWKNDWFFLRVRKLKL